MRRTILILLLAAPLLIPTRGFGMDGVQALDLGQQGTPKECRDLPSGPAPTSGDGVRYETDGDEVPLNEQVVIQPPRVDLDRALAPGDSFTCMLTIRSRREQATTFQLEPLGVVGSREPNASFEFIGPDDERYGATAGSWIVPAVDEVTLQPRGVAKVPVTVTIPAEPPVGSAYGSIDVVSRTRAREGETELGIESHLASVFLLRIGGEGEPELHLRNVDAPGLRWSREAWPLTAKLDNDGTLHATTSGRVRVRSMFGNTVAELPIRDETVLPAGRVPVDVRWKGVPWFGLYRYDVRAADDDEVATAGGWFVALPPWWVLALISAVILALVVRSMRRRRAVDDGDVTDWDDDQLVDHDDRA